MNLRVWANVVHKANALVHVSGHAAAGELLYCYNIVKPKYVMPVHGEWRHLRANAELAIKTESLAAMSLLLKTVSWSISLITEQR